MSLRNTSPFSPDHDLARPRSPRWLRAGILATAIWVVVAGAAVIWNAQAGIPWPALALVLAAAVGTFVATGLGARLSGLHEWSRAAVVMAGVICLSGGVVALVLLAWRANL